MVRLHKTVISFSFIIFVVLGGLITLLFDSLIGRLVPIFANNKKKRLKEALYANPTAEEIDRETEHSLSGMGCIYNESKEMGVQKQSCSPAQRLNSEQHKNSVCATNRREFTNTRTGNRYQGILQYEHQVKPVPRRFKNAGDHLSTACTSVTLQNNIPRWALIPRQFAYVATLSIFFSVTICNIDKGISTVKHFIFI